MSNLVPFLNPPPSDLGAWACRKNHILVVVKRAGIEVWRTSHFPPASIHCPYSDFRSFTMDNTLTPQYWTDSASGARFARVGQGEWYKVPPEPLAPPICVSHLLAFYMLGADLNIVQLPSFGSFMGQSGLPAVPQARSVAGGPSGDLYPPPPLVSSARSKPVIDPRLLSLPTDDDIDREIQRHTCEPTYRKGSAGSQGGRPTSQGQGPRSR